MKIHPVGAKLFHADGHDEAKSLFAILRMRLKIIKPPLMKMSFQQQIIQTLMPC